MIVHLRYARGIRHSNSTKILKKSIKIKRSADENGKNITTVKMTTYFGPKQGAKNVTTG